MGRGLIFILGGARSGKSAFAQHLAGRMGGRVVYVATGEAGDEEMAERIAIHRASRPGSWRTIEAPLDVGVAIRSAAGEAEVVLVDCVTLMANNVIGSLPDPIRLRDCEAAVGREIEGLLAAYEGSEAVWIVVSNEVGLGLVPPYPLGRFYRDSLGKANQRLAAEADTMYLMVAGLPQVLKGEDLWKAVQDGRSSESRIG